MVYILKKKKKIENNEDIIDVSCRLWVDTPCNYL